MSQMDAVSPAFVAALQGSFEYVVQVDVWADGQLVLQGLDVTGGSVKVQAGQAVRSSINVTVADPDGVLRPTGLDSTLSPYGPELNIKAGIRLGARTELVSLGWFPIVSVDVDQRWRIYRDPSYVRRTFPVDGATTYDAPTVTFDDPTVPFDGRTVGHAVAELDPSDMVRIPSGTVTISAVDRMQWVREAGFEARESPKKSSVLTEIARLLQGVAPWQPPDITDRDIPSGVSYGGDRMDAVTMLADALDTDPIVNAAGSVTLQPRAQGDPVWTVAGGEGGVLVSWKRKLARDGTYNAAVVYGQDPQYGLAPKVGRAYQADGPLRYRQGMRIPYTQSSPILTSQAQVDAAAATTLARVVSQNAQTVDVECTPNPALEVGDMVTLQALRGTVPVQVSTISLPLTAGRMQLSCTVDPVLIGQVA